MNELHGKLKSKLVKMLERNERKAVRLHSAYDGKESALTFHAGWRLGYWEGRVAAIEEMLDLLEDYCKGSGSLPPSLLASEYLKLEDKYVCDCMENYGKTCKHPEKYRNGGCNE